MSEVYMRCPVCFVNPVPVSPSTSSVTAIKYVCHSCFSGMAKESGVKQEAKKP